MLLELLDLRVRDERALDELGEFWHGSEEVLYQSVIGNLEKRNQ